MSDDWDVIIITYINTILFLHVHNGFYYSTFDWIRLSDSYLLKRSCTPCCAKSMYSYPTRIGSWHRRAPQIEYHVQRTNVFLISIVYTRKATYQISNHSINWDPIFLWRNFSLSFKAVKSLYRNAPTITNNVCPYIQWQTTNFKWINPLGAEIFAIKFGRTDGQGGSIYHQLVERVTHKKSLKINVW